MRVLTVEGGRSAEREISLVSAEWVAEELSLAGHRVTRVVIDRDGSWKLKENGEQLHIFASGVPWKLACGDTAVDFDVVFPVLHGSYGEDGTFQGLCETAGWKYAGVPVMGSAAAMDKHIMKSLAKEASIPVVPWVHIDENEGSSLESLRAEIEDLGFPLFVKPSRLGSSVGITRVKTPDELKDALKKAKGFDSRVLIEKAVTAPREIEVSVMGNGLQVLSSIPGEIIPGREWYDYQAKYNCSRSEDAIPADLSASHTRNIRLMAEKIFRLAGGRGFARVDFLVNESGTWFNEMNTIPGFTEISMFPKLWKASGTDSFRMLDYILDEAVNRASYGLLSEEK
ncbi:D-alanine--D-alanine ligase A [Candidatus Fermentibacteria bacterium]|nr:MAG: D-alanine--D-alanine ligase A [Candidatus Fermentibacteria bacterium]